MTKPVTDQSTHAYIMQLYVTVVNEYVYIHKQYMHAKTIIVCIDNTTVPVAINS